MFQTPGQAPLRGSSTTDKPFGFHDATVDGGWQVPGEPYVNTSQDDSGRFDWWRARMLGGRTNHWGRYSFRNGPYDFKPKSRDGLGFDWPLSYDGRCAVLRQGRDADRRLRRERRTGEHAGLAAGLPAAAAEAARERPAGRATGEAHRHSHRRRSPRRAHPGAGSPEPAGETASGQCECAVHPGRRTCRAAPPVSGRRPAGAAARSARTTSRPPCTCRPPSRPASSTSSSMRWSAR